MSDVERVLVTLGLSWLVARAVVVLIEVAWLEVRTTRSRMKGGRK